MTVPHLVAELLDEPLTNGSKTFIVSGGGIDLMRVFLKEPGVDFIDDGPGKPVAIDRFKGRRPIAAFGNSDRDLPMLQCTAAGAGSQLLAYVHHDDAEWEWAYDRESDIGQLDRGLDEALERGWVIVSMQKDWRRVFEFD